MNRSRPMRRYHRDLRRIRRGTDLTHRQAQAIYRDRSVFKDGTTRYIYPDVERGRKALYTIRRRARVRIQIYLYWQNPSGVVPWSTPVLPRGRSISPRKADQDALIDLLLLQADNAGDRYDVEDGAHLRMGILIGPPGSG